MENQINYEAVKNDMNNFYDKHTELFSECSEEETKAICMLFAAMNQGIKNCGE